MNEEPPHAGRALSPEHRLLGQAVRELRARQGLSQAELADGAGLGELELAAIERGQVDLEFTTFVALARAVPARPSELARTFERRRAAG